MEFPKGETFLQGSDGVWYSRGRPEDREEALECARTEPADCGQLYDAVSDNDFDKVKEILCVEDKSPEKVEYRKWYVNEKSWMDWRTLHAAAEAGYIEMVQFLLDCGSEINALTTAKQSALTLAAAGGHDKIVKLLLENGADILVQTETGLCGTALHYAAGKGHYECVRLLAEAPGFKDLVNQFSADYCTALYYAAISYHTDVIKLLLENGAKEAINAPDWDGNTALHMAASMPGSLEIVKLLVEVGGADIFSSNEKGRTPAIAAKEVANIDVVNYFGPLAK